MYSDSLCSFKRGMWEAVPRSLPRDPRSNVLLSLDGFGTYSSPRGLSADLYTHYVTPVRGERCSDTSCRQMNSKQRESPFE